MHFILQIRQAIQKILIQIRHQRRHRIQTAHLMEEGRSYLLLMVSAQTFEPFLLAYISTHTWIGKLPSRFVRQSTTRPNVGFFCPWKSTTGPCCINNCQLTPITTWNIFGDDWFRSGYKLKNYGLATPIVLNYEKFFHVLIILKVSCPAFTESQGLYFWITQ